MKLHRLSAAALLLLAAAACSPSAKNEEQYWSNHQKNAAEYGERWPGFKQVLAAQHAKAQPVWDEASKLSDEKQKGEKMKEANGIYGPLVSRVGEVKYKIEGIEGTIKKLQDLKLTKSENPRRQEAIKAAYAAIDEVNTAMAAAAPATPEDAETALKEQISALISAQGAADRAYDGLKPAKAAKKKK